MIAEKGLSSALNARIIGSGRETIVLAHGYGTEQSIWDKIIAPMFDDDNNNYKVVLFDWPFSAAVEDQSLYDPNKYSSLEPFADDLITLMTEMNLKDANFVGHSMSGMIGCLASIKRPDLFKRLLLIAASPRYTNIDDYEGGFTSSDIEDLLKNIESNYENWVSAFSLGVVDPNDMASVNKFRDCLQRMRGEVALSLAKTVFCSDYRDILEKVETPCTIIQTSSDMVVPRSVAQYMEKKIKGKATLEIIDTNGHFPQLTAHLDLVKVLNGVLGFGFNQI
ncbi:strigolactone esterase D14 [Arachis duranensis]|uniref:Strigolactone esterase D14 n=1 Tax=Arachis duranensis TaxID=130453 RepID=A0A6P4DE28_ARADU|nr:strigolactone esterase D14 [Arachis duranensis]